MDKLKKIALTFVLLLMCCDGSLLFAAQMNGDGNGDAALQQQQLQQIQQLQSNNTQPPANSPSISPIATAQAAPAPEDQQPSAPSAPVLTNQPQAAIQQPTLAPPASPVQAPTQTPAQTAPSPQGAVSVQAINNAAFNAMTQNLLPMSSEQIQRLRQLFDQSQYAAAALPNTPSRPVISSQFVNLAPGTTPPVIRLQQGMVSVMAFLDSTGAPWPIQAYDIGNPSAFNIQWNKTDNSMIIQPLTPYTYGNLAVVLQGLSTPLMLTFITGQKAFDARIDLHVQGFGPNAQAPAVIGLPNGADPLLLGVLDGVPPPGSTTLQVSGGTAQAWILNDRLFVRTRYTILSPGWLATMSSADGMRAYEMPKVPLLLATQNGKIAQLKVEGF